MKTLLTAVLLLTASVLPAAAGDVTVTSAADALQRYRNLPQPDSAIRLSNIPQRFEGATVVVALTVTADGRVKDVTEVTPLPEDLRGCLFRQMASWQFEPARDKGGRAVALRIIYPLTFVENAAKHPAKRSDV